MQCENKSKRVRRWCSFATSKKIPSENNSKEAIMPQGKVKQQSLSHLAEEILNKIEVTPGHIRANFNTNLIPLSKGSYEMVLQFCYKTGGVELVNKFLTSFQVVEK